MCRIEDYSFLKMTPVCRAILEHELEMWHNMYLPVSGTVLDVGAGCGETAFFYLKHGAKQVVCIEGNKDCFNNLCSNFKDDDRVIPMSSFVNNIKIDVSGYERGMVFETHFPFSWKKYDHPVNYVHTWRLEENWGNIFRKIIRKVVHA